MGDQRSPPLAKDLLNYYLRNPASIDTSEGLARWRLLEEYVERTVRETEEALGWLVRHGFLRELRRPGGRPVFVMDPERRADAETFVNGADDRGRRGGK